ncbi:MAG: phosphoribosyl-AMP cyclohydrolase [Candidatus Omnitrophica bacterium]|nr:phosphoribosyl-AMP cyclohydrolase [Candidatus Omnitrophota bacterium]
MKNNRVPSLKFDEKGLIAAIVQDSKSGDVLMIAYMNKESLEITLKEKRTCFYSRSRQTLWRKGESSGHVQKVKSIYYDCDKDALLIKVKQEGVACHTGEWSCFYRRIL